MKTISIYVFVFVFIIIVTSNLFLISSDLFFHVCFGNVFFKDNEKSLSINVNCIPSLKH